jgi:MYXO-CTERM domain-containing protein
MSPDALRGLVAAVGLLVVAGATRAEAFHTGYGLAVAELQRASLGLSDADALVSDEHEALLGIAPRDFSFRDMISHSNNTRFVLEGSGVVLEPLGALWDPGVDRKGLFEDAPLSGTPSSVGAVPAPGALWLLVLGTIRTRRRRRD